ncbi:MAG: electron transfer flavoprotein subunit alpha/FixB family protein [Cyclobacteriaceae bacterium]|nr:electron transfer flavoprotein subunit alpha/FixB family protein [Cyclobacteriaceae bacterium]
MPVYVFIERDETKIRKTSYEAISYGAEIASIVGNQVVGVVLGSIDKAELEGLSKFGCHKVIHCPDPVLDQPMIRSYVSVLSELMEAEPAEFFITAQSALADPVAAMLAVRTGASVATNVTSVPDLENGCRVQRGIYTGKAFETVELKSEKKVISIRKNACGIKEYEINAEIVTSDLKPEEYSDVKITGADKVKGDILLSEAKIIVSGGRGMKGPENWGMIEELADTLGAAKGCSKPVSDANWRPHHEHVGQTGIKVSPDLYIAIGISGAIQHVAGVSASKFIVVINNDPEAPFFKVADYGMLGDAFQIVPRLIESIKKYK